MHARTSSWDVRVEVYWIIAVLENDALETRKQVSVDMLLDALDASLRPATEKSLFNTKMLQRVRHLVHHYSTSRAIQRTSMSRAYLCDALAVAFSHLPASVCWKQGGVAHCLGEPFDTSASTDHFVATGFRKIPWKGLVATIQMSLSEWAKTQVRQKLPLETACLSSDSTLQDLGFDCKDYSTRVPREMRLPHILLRW